MYEIDPLLRLSWFLAAAAPSATPPPATSPAVAAVSAPAAVERIAVPDGPLPASKPEASEIPHHPSLTDTFFFGLGGGFYSSSTEARLNSSTGLGTNIDFEDALGLESTSWTPQGLARWRFSDRWRVELEFFQLNRSGRKQTDNDITWGDTTFPAGTTISTKFDVSVTRLSCGYSFFKTQDKEIGVALGFHVTDFDASLEGPSSSDGGKILAPLPVGSIYGQVALTDEWAVSGRLDAFRLELDPYHGRILSIGVDALYQPWDHWGFGLGWRTLQIEGGVEGDKWKGDISTTFTGPIAFITASF